MARYSKMDTHRRQTCLKIMAVVGVCIAIAGLGILMVGLLVGNGANAPVSIAVPATLTGAPPATDEPATKETATMPKSPPVRVQIPAIGVDSTLVDLGLNPDGTMEVPVDGTTAGWYTRAPTPGERGPAVIAAHVDWQGEKGVFYQLSKLQTGDKVSVQRRDGSTAHFVIDKVAEYPKNEFPTEQVYGDLAYPGLRLITCGGDLDRKAHSYLDNIVVYAHLTGST